MLDWKCAMKEKRYRQQIILEDIQEDVSISTASYIGHVETQAIEEILSVNYQHQPEPTFAAMPEEDNQIISVLLFVLPVLNDNTMYHKLEDRCNLGKFQIAIRSTTCSGQKYLAENIHTRDYMSSEYS